jgi:hypothetical protein
VLDDGNIETMPASVVDELRLNNYSAKILLNYITNLQKENKEFYQLMEMQNKREYRSKFLKDFQKEHGKNVFPDYDEIYKRYDDYKQRNEKAVEYIKKHSFISKDTGTRIVTMNVKEDEVLLNILEGGDEE